MFSNHLKITLRNLRRQPLYTLLTILGLAIGIASCLLIILFVQDELSYDQFHVLKNRIYRVNMGMREDGRATNMNGSIAAGPSLAGEFPEIERYVRFRKFGWNEKRVVAYKDRRFYESRFMLADSTLFRIFSFPLAEGDPDRALVVPHSIVMTSSIARKYFGNEDPMGKKVSIDQNNNGTFVDFTVTGVAEDLPLNSSIRFDLVGSMSSETASFNPWSLESIFTFVLVRPGVDMLALEAKLPAFLERRLGRKTTRSLHFQPLGDIRLHSDLNGKMEIPGDAATVYVLSAVTVFVLLIACINFVNLSTARSSRRAREVGMRKVLGAQRPQLIRQFIGESTLLAAASVAVGLVLAEGMMPVFNRISEKKLSLISILTPVGIGLIVALIAVVGVLAGSYPAYVLSSFRPVSVLHSGSGGKSGGAALLRKGLVIFQFTISVVIMICTGIAYFQMNYVRTMDLGFQREQMLVLPLNNQIRAQVDGFKQELRSNSKVLGVSYLEEVPGRAGNGAGFKLDDHEMSGAYRMFVDEDFLKTFGVTLVAGRDFSRDRPADKTESFIVNEALVRAQGIRSPEEAVGKRFTMYHGDSEKHGVIIGVTNDFHIQSLHDRIEETMLTIMPPAKMNFVSIRLAPGDLNSTMNVLRKAWASASPQYPFDYYFVDQDFDLLHRADEKLGEIFGYFAILAIAAASLGLFGLASYAAAQRTKELGIRKVLGATAPGLAVLLAREFLLLIGIAVVLSWPIAWFWMDRWLQDFAYHISMSPWPFILAGLAGLVIASVTIVYQAVSAALSNPVDTLRHE